MAQSATPQTPQAPPRELANAFPAVERKLWAVVDGDSAAYGSCSPGERATLSKLRAVLNELAVARIPCDVVVASYTWNRKGFGAEFETLSKERGIISAPVGAKTDDLVLLLAKKRRAQGFEVYLVSNDAYNDYPAAKDFPRIGFAVTRDGLVLTNPEVSELARPASHEPGPGVGSALACGRILPPSQRRAA